jgi:Flp pilus assembly protein TadG
MSMITVKMLRKGGPAPADDRPAEMHATRTAGRGFVSASRRRRSSGNTMIELSFIFLVFAALLIGTFDFGQFLFVHQALVERGRWALRYGVANSNAGSNGDATCVAEGLATCVQNQMLYYSSSTGTSGYFGLTTAMVVVTTLSQTGSSTVPIPSTTPTYTSYQLLIKNYPYKMYSLYSAGSYTGPNIYITFPAGQY